MSGIRRPLLGSKGEVTDRARRIREAMLRTGPRVKARDIALEIYDAFTFSINLTKLLVIDALTLIARQVVHEERERRSAGARAAVAAGEIAEGTPEFPDFDEICRECPRNYALPGNSGEPNDTIYVETFDDDFALLPKGVGYLRAHGLGALRNATALENLYLLCQRLGGRSGETPREILRRSHYDPGC